MFWSPLLPALLAFSSVSYAQDRTTESGEASIKDPNEECKPYSYQPTVSQASRFPTIWQTANLVSSDSEGNAKWNSIKGGVPTNIAVKGQPNGNFSAFTPGYIAQGQQTGKPDPDCWWTFNTCTTPKLAGLPADIIDIPEPLSLGFGFDDGPNCSHNAFYDYLTSQGQKATMFYIGSNVMDWPLEAQRALADGHELCVHTWSHQYMTALSNEVVFAELWYTMQAIKTAVGVTPTCWRPPYGDIDDRVRYIANALGLRSILWTYDSDDWKNGIEGVTPQTVDGNYQDLITAAQNGSLNTHGTIILTHELNNYTMGEAIKQFPALKAAFKHIVPVGVGLNVTQPYLEGTHNLPSFEQYASGDTSASNTGSKTSGGGGTSSTASPGSSGTARPSGGASLGSIPQTGFAAICAMLLSAIFL